MKRVIIALTALGIIAGLSFFHAYKITRINDEFQASAESIEAAFAANDWQTINYEMDNIQQRWENSRLWACLTIATKQIDEIDVSLSQSLEYAKLNASPDFIGEFRMLCMKMEHLPKQEGLSLEELL